MSVRTESFTLPASVLHDRPGRLLSELRKSLAEVRRRNALPQGSGLMDIGFKRNSDCVEVTFFFQLPS